MILLYRYPIQADNHVINGSNLLPIQCSGEHVPWQQASYEGMK